VKDLKLADGRARVVRHGYGPAHGLHGKDSLAGRYGRSILEPQYVSTDQHPGLCPCTPLWLAPMRDHPLADPASASGNRRPAVRRLLPLSLTFDHRVVTGGEAARFLVALKSDLELMS
jgi:hypothetical protein